MLDVYLHEQLVGHLLQDDGGQMSFEYLESCLHKQERQPCRNPAIAEGAFPTKECRGFFGGILRKRANGKSSPAIWVSARTTTTPCLNRSARMCGSGYVPSRRAGAAQARITTTGSLTRRNWPESSESCRSGLCSRRKGVRLSLAGAQDKVAVRIEGEEVSLPLGGAPSTHILKPAVERFAGVVFNERCA